MSDRQGRDGEVVKRRADVVGIFQFEDSTIRLIDAVLFAQNDDWQSRQRYTMVENSARSMPPGQTRLQAKCRRRPRGRRNPCKPWCFSSFFGVASCTQSDPQDKADVGEVAEWSKAHAWKVCRRETVSRVRIPSSPPLALDKRFSRSRTGRIFPLFSRVMRVGLITGPRSERRTHILSGLIFSGPVNRSHSGYQM